MDGRVKLRFRKSQTLQYADNLALPGVTVGLFKTVGKLRIFFHGLLQFLSGKMADGLLQLADILLHGDDILFGVQHFLINGAAGCDVDDLREISHGGAALENDLSAVRLVFTGDDFQESGFAGAVDSDEGRLLSFVN